MRRKDAAVGVDEAGLGVRHLAVAGLAAQLAHHLDGVEHAARRAGMGEGQKAAMGVARQAAAEVEGAGGGGRSGLALLEDADRFELNDEDRKSTRLNSSH